jgi:predicted O-linked N-acetylglucosamine transferase (SPINDLY family)
VDPGPSSYAGLDSDPARKLRVGYVSADFRQHAVASFIEPIIAAHDRTQVSVTCYSDGMPDAVTARLREVARPDAWRDVRPLTDEALARQIIDDKIDILVDLAGHTSGNRLLTFARRPAPVQITYCGYPGTTGLAAIGWRLTDALADPPGDADRQHAEQLWRLPHGFLCFQPDPELGTPSRPPCSLNGGTAVTFGSFNNLSKLGDEVLAAWARILEGVPGSRLFLKSRALTDEEPRQRLRRVFADHGIAPQRLEFAPYAATTQDHLSLYSQVDLALDPFPYNGTTTTCEALWMGVPVLSLGGKTHAGRVGASLLNAVGFPELVVGSIDKYVAAAVALAADRERLATYRAELRPRMTSSPLTNPRLITADIESAYREMWRQFCATRS